MIQYILPAYVGVSSFSGTKIKEAAASFIVSWYFSDYDYFDVFYLKFGHLFYIKKICKISHIFCRAVKSFVHYRTFDCRTFVATDFDHSIQLTAK